VIKQGLIVSIQGYSQQTTVELAARCLINGAVGIRTDQDISWLKMDTDFPIIGLKKLLDKKYYITTSKEAIQYCMWADYVAIDSRKGNVDLSFLYCFANSKGKKIIADVQKIEDVINILNYHKSKMIKLPDYIATTFSFLKDGKQDFKLISDIRQLCQIPIIAEGKIKTKEQVKKAYDHGANNVCIGSEISDIRYLINKFKVD
jgi:N-acylglucosamine-6-phosphate 2-epimerase